MENNHSIVYGKIGTSIARFTRIMHWIQDENISHILHECHCLRNNATSVDIVEQPRRRQQCYGKMSGVARLKHLLFSFCFRTKLTPYLVLYYCNRHMHLIAKPTTWWKSSVVNGVLHQPMSRKERQWQPGPHLNPNFTFRFYFLTPFFICFSFIKKSKIKQIKRKKAGCT